MNQSIAFVGATGAGKTTILKLITRDFDIQKGQILIDGIDIKTIHRQSLRRFIGQMLQDVFMFSGTIKSNITLKEESFTDDDVLIATKYVNADRLLKKQPKGIHEEVRERGNNFSAGERQLISFARTLIHQPRIIILDEATANIDTETEIIIQDSLKKMLTIGTSFIVAHRLSTIQHVDQIIVMAHGQIIEKGSHQELLKEKGHYYNLYQIQFKDALVG
jgi:ATP-binding cassette subfamily B protein